jgi:tetratricopeptide (TPR) repeat protein
MKPASGLLFVTGLLLLSFGYSLSAQSRSDQITAISSALRAKEFIRALQLLQSALQHSPSDPQLLTLQGLAYSGQGHNKDALACFRTALKTSPDYLPALEGAAQIEYNAGTKDAIPLLQHILTLRPRDATSHAMIGAVFYKENNCPAALEHFDASAGLADSQPEALRELGWCYVKLKQFDKDVAAFHKAVETDHGDSHYRYQMAAAQVMAERPKHAIETLKPLLQTPNPPAPALQLAA